jgi:gliding motility-associated-like protein
MLYAYNAYLCVDSTQQPITVLPPNPFFIPNAFTPNGDGKNDEFFVDLQEGATLRSMRIFDRSGEKVFDGLGSWDGTYKGKPCPPNVYVYEITIHLDTAPGDLLRKGSVTLIR